MSLSLKLVRRASIATLAASSLLLVACGDDSTSSADSAAADTTAAAGAASGATTTFDLASVAAGLTTGKATDAGKKFCQTMSDLDELQSSGDDLASTKKEMVAMADAIKANAPAEIKKPAESYADMLKTVANNLKSKDSIDADIAKGMASKAQDIAIFIGYLATNCTAAAASAS
ncbi:MAG: hypothetical protein AB7L13_14480 [Acidimicrobiia bacterium]